MLEKKRNSLCYYAVQKCITMDESLVGHIPSTKNVADVKTKVMCWQKKRYLVSNSCMIFMISEL